MVLKPCIRGDVVMFVPIKIKNNKKYYWSIINIILIIKILYVDLK